MALENKKTDDLWKQLNAKPIVKDSKRFDQVWSQFQQCSKSKKAGSKKENSPASGVGEDSLNTKDSTVNTSVTCTKDAEPTAAEVCEAKSICKMVDGSTCWI
eukprot:1271196-Pyramimonas_sp.AAC.1